MQAVEHLPKSVRTIVIDYVGCVQMAEAKFAREELMKERKFIVSKVGRLDCNCCRMWQWRILDNLLTLLCPIVRRSLRRSSSDRLAYASIETRGFVTPGGNLCCWRVDVSVLASCAGCIRSFLCEHEEMIFLSFLKAGSIGVH